MTRRKIPLETLSPAQQAAARAQLGAPAPPSGALRSPHTGRGAKRGPSKLELRFARHLDTLRTTGIVAAWDYEPIRVILPARGATYRPDYLVQSGCPDLLGPTDGPFCGSHHLVLVEVKPSDRSGRPYMQAASWLRVRLAADRLRDLVPLFLAFPSSRARDASWSYVRVEPRR